MERVSGETVIGRAADHLGGSVSARQVSDSIDVEGDPSSNRISVTATDPDPRFAAELADAVAESAVRALRGRRGEVLSDARVPTSPSAPKVARNIAVGGVLGLMIGIALALLLERLDPRIRDIDELGTRWDR